MSFLLDKLIFVPCSNNKFWTSDSLRSLTDDPTHFLVSYIKNFLIVSLEILRDTEICHDYSFVISFQNFLTSRIKHLLIARLDKYTYLPVLSYNRDDGLYLQYRCGLIQRIQWTSSPYQLDLFYRIGLTHPLYSQWQKSYLLYRL